MMAMDGIKKKKDGHRPQDKSSSLRVSEKTQKSVRHLFFAFLGDLCKIIELNGCFV